MSNRPIIPLLAKLFACLLCLSLLKLTAFAATGYDYTLFDQDTSVEAETRNPADNDLPELGDPSSAILPDDKAQRLGRAWLKRLRAEAPIVYDPLTQNYLENLLYRLASYSDLANPQLELVLINSPAINAFAVPGGIIGVNAGLFLHTQSEDELSSVLSHEIAHLSQKHFARRWETEKRNNKIILTTLLASIVLAATSNSEAGLAAMVSTQAAAAQTQLAYSRHHEREADRVGMQTLARAGMNPYAMPAFFETMLKRTRLTNEAVPEFLLTHPVTDSRISDSKLRAAQLSYTPGIANPEFLLIKARVTAYFSTDKNHAIESFKSMLETSSGEQARAARYGLVISLMRGQQYEDARKHLDILLEEDPNRIAYLVSLAELHMKQEQFEDAYQLLNAQLALNPGNHPLTMAFAKSLIQTGRYGKAATYLENHTLSRPEDPYLWNLLAEAYGKSGNRTGTHRAKAEYYYLINDFGRAEEQLKYALKLSKDVYQLHAKIKHRLFEMRSHRYDLEL